MSFSLPLLTLTLCLVPGFQGKPLVATDATPRSPRTKTVLKTGEPITVLRFADLFVPEEDHLRLSDKVKALNGKRVRITGFIAEQEEPMKGAFYLCPIPVATDESGAGIGDIPVNAIRVTLPGLEGKIMAPRRGAVIVVGKLDVGSHEEKDGTVSFVRLRADRPRIVELKTPSRTESKQRKDAKSVSRPPKTKQ